VHPLSITGIEITFENDLHLRLIEWGQAAKGNMIGIRRAALGGS
jgi:hypothetical protein